MFLNWEFLAAGLQQGQQPFHYSLSLRQVRPLCCSPLPHSKVFPQFPPHVFALNSLQSSIRSFCCWMIYGGRGRLATHRGSIQVIFISPSVGSINLTGKMLPTAALRPIRNICILLLCSPYSSPQRNDVFLKVHLQGSIPSTDNTIK